MAYKVSEDNSLSPTKVMSSNCLTNSPKSKDIQVKGLYKRKKEQILPFWEAETREYLVFLLENL